MAQIEVKSKSTRPEKIAVNVENIITANSDFETALADMSRSSEALLESIVKFCKKVSAESLDVLGKVGFVLENELKETPKWNIVKTIRLKREIASLRSTKKSLREIING